jgi:hypothetical protein
VNRWEIARQLRRKGYGYVPEEFAQPYDVVLGVNTALAERLRPAGQSAPDTAVLLDALRLIPGAHEDLDRAELDITAALRDREVSWEEIGGAFAYTSPGRRQAAAARHGRLRRRYPFWTPPGTANGKDTPDAQD